MHFKNESKVQTKSEIESHKKRGGNLKKKKKQHKAADSARDIAQYVAILPQIARYRAIGLGERF